MEKEVLEVILKKLDKESRIASVIDVQSVPALSKGENYTSTILRVTLKVVLGNGRTAKKSFIMKQMITDGECGELLKELNTAKLENHVYSVVLKHMNYLMEEFEDAAETVWCQFIHYDPKLSCILFEDLKASGYTLVPRQKGLDFEHAMLVLNSLGRLHGMAKVLEQRGIVSKDDFKPYDLFDDLKLVKCLPYAGVLSLAKVMEECWGPDWKDTAKKLKISFDPFAAKWQKVGLVECEKEFRVLNHGDCWSNNMMFKYDFQNRPISVKFLDFQGPHYNTPCIDVTYFFFLGIQPAVRRSNYQLLLKTYHDSLLGTLDKFGYTGSKPTFEEITNTMKRLEFFGLVFFAAFFPLMVCSSLNAVNIDNLLKSDGKEGYNEDIFKEPGIVEKMGPDLIEFVEKHVSDLN